MSYDLSLFRVAPGADPNTVYSQFDDCAERICMGEQIELPPGVQLLDQSMQENIAAAAMSAGIPLERTDLVPDPELQDPPSIELHDTSATGLSITIYRTGVVVSINYWQQPVAVVNVIWNCLAAMCEAGGLAIGDLQADRAFDPHHDRADFLASFAESQQLAQRAQSRPWWKFW